MGIDVLIKKRENQRISATISQGSYYSDNTTGNAYGAQNSSAIFPMRTVIAWLNELAVLHQISKLSISLIDNNSALLLTDCSNFTIC